MGVLLLNKKITPEYFYSVGTFLLSTDMQEFRRKKEINWPSR